MLKMPPNTNNYNPTNLQTTKQIKIHTEAHPPESLGVHNHPNKTTKEKKRTN
jgi:hypothetical protein